MLFNKKPQEDYGNGFSTTFNEPHASTVNPLPGEHASMASRKASTAPTRSVIDSWLTITGNLESEGEVQVDGQIHGDIRCAHLVVGKDATIIGNIIAEEVVVRGKVKGTIRANCVTLQDTSVVESEIYHKSLAIEQGACFEGQSRRREEPMKSEIKDLQAAAGEMKYSEKAKAKQNGMENGTVAA